VRARSFFVLAPALAVAAALILVQGIRSDDGGPAPASAEAAAGSEGTTAGRFIASIKRPRAVLWAVGDGGIDSPEASRVATLIARGSVDRLLYLGDVYPEGTQEDYEENYAPSYGRLARRTAPTLGNHEAPNADEGYNPYWARIHGMTPPPYYAFRVGRWKILSLNSEIDHDPGSPQVRWLHRQVAGDGNCRIAFWHRPRFSAGTHHGDVEHVAPLWDALKGRAKIVLNGHEHNMQRFRRLAGITEFISGAGGASLSPVDESDSRLRYSNDARYGALRLRLRRKRVRYAFVVPSGRVLDRGAITCGR
jgi:Calcineurin-like phosphoesterase